MNEQRIREIAEQSSYHAENSVDYYSGIVDGLTWEAKILKARDLKFAELIVAECLEACSRANEIRHFVSPSQPQVVLSCILEIEKTFRS